MRMKIFMAAVVVLLASPWVVDYFLVPILSQKLSAGEEDSQRNEVKYLPEFEADLVVLGPKLVFLNVPRTKDAGPYLNPLCEWSAGSVGESKLETKIKTNQVLPKLVMDEAIKDKLKQHKDNPFTFEGDIPDVDTTFLRELRAYDHWDIDKHGPLDELPRYDFTSPSVTYHLPFLKLHLIKVRSGSDEEKLESLLDVLHYGELALTTESLAGSMIFVSAIKLVQKSTSDLPELQLKLGPWANLLNETNRLKRVLWAINHFARPSAHTDLQRLQQIYQKTFMTTGLCAAIRETTGTDYQTWSLMAEGMPVQYNAYRKLVEENAKDCRLTWLKTKAPPWQKLPNDKDLMSDPKSFFATTKSPENLEVPFWGPWILPVIRHLPNTRKLVASLLAKVATPDYTQPYRDPPTQQNSSI